MSDNKDVSTNDYGISDAEYDQERKTARAAAMGDITEVPVEEPAPTEEVVVTEPPIEAAQDTKTAKVEVEKDPLSEFPDDVRDKVASLLKAERAESDKYKHKYESDIGRVTSYQKQYEEARREKLEIEKQLAALKKPATKTLKELAPGPRIKEATEQDEVLVETLDELRNQIRKEMKEEFDLQLEARTKPLYEHREREEQARFTQKLDSTVENWREIVYSMDGGRIAVDDKGSPVFSEAWATYINDQPLPIQQAILQPTTPEEALWAIENYHQWGLRKGYIAAPEASTEHSVSDTKVPNADAILKKRQDDLKRAAPPKQNQMPLSQAPVDTPGDPAWEARMRAKAREAIAKGDLSIYQNAR